MALQPLFISGWEQLSAYLRFQIMKRKSVQQNRGKTEASLLAKVSLDTCPFILG